MSLNISGALRLADLVCIAAPYSDFKTISTSNKVIAFSFIAREVNLTSLSVYIASSQVSPVVDAYLVPDTGYISTTPNTSPFTNALASQSNVALPPGIKTFNLSATLVAGSVYWLVLKYVSGTSAGIRFTTAGYPLSNLLRPNLASTTYFASALDVEPITWASGAALNTGLLRQAYSSGNSYGYLLNNALLLASVGQKVYHTDSSNWFGIGNKYVLSLTHYTNVSGFVLNGRKNTSLSGDLYCDLYINGSKAATSVVLDSNTVSTGQSNIIFVFDRPVAVPPGVAATFIVTSTLNASDNSSNSYNAFALQYADKAEYSNELPLGGNCQAVTWNGSTGVFSDVANTVLVSAVLLDPNDPFPTPPINRRTSTGR